MATRKTSSGARKKKTVSAQGTTKRGSGKRDLVKAPNATFFARRKAGGQFKELDEVGRSQKADRRTNAQTKVRSGYGDRGDQ